MQVVGLPWVNSSACSCAEVVGDARTDMRQQLGLPTKSGPCLGCYGAASATPGEILPRDQLTVRFDRSYRPLGRTLCSVNRLGAEIALEAEMAPMVTAPVVAGAGAPASMCCGDHQP